MDLRLRDHLAKLFNEQKKSKKDVRENHRAMAKLLKEAQRLKTVLSANMEFMAQVSPGDVNPEPSVVQFVGHPQVRVSKCLLDVFLRVQVEGLMDDIDFKSKVTRAEFEELCADLFERVSRPVQEALSVAEMKLVSILVQDHMTG